MNHRGVPAALAAVTTLLVVANALAACTAPAHTASTNPTRTALLPAGLAEQTAAAAEHDPQFVHKVTLYTDRIACVADPFGTDPADASSVIQVRTVYAILFCAGVNGTGNLDQAEALVIPGAVALKPTPAVVVPVEDGNWTTNVHRVVPRQWWTRATSGLSDPEAAHEQLRRRLAELAKTSS